jgi:hypothetical protein
VPQSNRRSTGSPAPCFSFPQRTRYMRIERSFGAGEMQCPRVLPQGSGLEAMLESHRRRPRRNVRNREYRRIFPRSAACSARLADSRPPSLKMHRAVKRRSFPNAYGTQSVSACCTDFRGRFTTVKEDACLSDSPAESLMRFCNYGRSGVRAIQSISTM